eukprot:UN12463
MDSQLTFREICHVPVFVAILILRKCVPCFDDFSFNLLCILWIIKVVIHKKIRNKSDRNEWLQRVYLFSNFLAGICYYEFEFDYFIMPV